MIFSTECGERFAYCLKRNIHLEQVELRNNIIDNESLAEFLNTLKNYNTTLKVLEIGNNQGQKSDIFKEVSKQLQYNYLIKQIIRPRLKLKESTSSDENSMLSMNSISFEETL